MSRITVVFCIVICCFGSAGTALAVEQTTLEPSSPEQSVLAVGDSLTHGTRHYLGGVLGSSWTVKTNGMSGRNTANSVSALRDEAKDGLQRVIVFAAGTNDPNKDTGDYRDDIGKVLKIAGPDRCVVLVNMGWTSKHHRKNPYRAMNRVLRQVQKSNDNVAIVDWDRIVSNGQVHLSDGIHPAPSGYRLRARAEARVVKQFCTPYLTR